MSSITNGETPIDCPTCGFIGAGDAIIEHMAGQCSPTTNTPTDEGLAAHLRQHMARECHEAADRIEALLADKAELQRKLGEEWQPIKAAPKDGTWIQLLVQGSHSRRITIDHLFVTVGRWRWSPDARLPHDEFPDDGGWLEAGNEWSDDWGGNIGWLYWKPLAEPPSRAALEAQSSKGDPA